MGESGSLGNGGPRPLPPPVLLIPNSSLRLHFKAWLVTEPPAAAGAEMILGCGRAQVGCSGAVQGRSRAPVPGLSGVFGLPLLPQRPVTTTGWPGRMGELCVSWSHPQHPGCRDPPGVRAQHRAPTRRLPPGTNPAPRRVVGRSDEIKVVCLPSIYRPKGANPPRGSL